MHKMMDVVIAQPSAKSDTEHDAHAPVADDMHHEFAAGLDIRQRVFLSAAARRAARNAYRQSAKGGGLLYVVS